MSFFQRMFITGRNLNKTVQVSPMRNLSIFDQVRLCGTPFHGSTKDTNFWLETGTGAGGTVTQGGGQVILAVDATNNSKAVYNSVRTGRYVSGTANKFRGVIRLPDLGSAGNNNVRNWGCATATDGFLFQLNGATFNIVVRKSGVADQVIPKASWTGTYAASFTLDTNVHTYELQFTNSSAWFFIDDNLVHTVSGTTSPSTTTLTFPVCLENINTGVGAAVSLNVRTASILRMGHETTIPQYKNITGAAATTVCKYGPGTLHKIVFNNTSGTSISIWDGVTGAAPSVAVGKVTTASAALGSWDYNCPFFTGLTIVTVGDNLDCTIIYE